MLDRPSRAKTPDRRTAGSGQVDFDHAIGSPRLQIGVNLSREAQRHRAIVSLNLDRRPGGSRGRAKFRPEPEIHRSVRPPHLHSSADLGHIQASIEPPYFEGPDRALHFHLPIEATSHQVDLLRNPRRQPLPHVGRTGEAHPLPPHIPNPQLPRPLLHSQLLRLQISLAPRRPHHHDLGDLPLRRLDRHRPVEPLQHHP